MDKGGYSFSTCWNIGKHPHDGRGLIEEIKTSGFGAVELKAPCEPTRSSAATP